jgi:uncharacterized Ntn-hydrolase superfamily protein
MVTSTPSSAVASGPTTDTRIADVVSWAKAAKGTISTSNIANAEIESRILFVIDFRL